MELKSLTDSCTCDDDWCATASESLHFGGPAQFPPTLECKLRAESWGGLALLEMAWFPTLACGNLVFLSRAVVEQHSFLYRQIHVRQVIRHTSRCRSVSENPLIISESALPPRQECQASRASS